MTLEERCKAALWQEGAKFPSKKCNRIRACVTRRSRSLSRHVIVISVAIRGRRCGEFLSPESAIVLHKNGWPCINSFTCSDQA